jgi:hypothetical protein
VRAAEHGVRREERQRTALFVAHANEPTRIVDDDLADRSSVFEMPSRHEPGRSFWLHPRAGFYGNGNSERGWTQTRAD